jgi:hypothetical protein
MSFLNVFKKVEPKKMQEQLLVYLRGNGLSSEVYETCDTSTLDDLFSKALGDEGYVDGDETRETETIMFLQGFDAEKMFELVEPVLRSYPLCEGARIAIYPDPMKPPKREFTL